MGMLNMKEPILSLVGLLAVVSLVGCQQASGRRRFKGTKSRTNH